jgi:hypothetical protein
MFDLDLTGCNVTDEKFVSLKSYLFSIQYQSRKHGNHYLWNVVNRHNFKMNNCYVSSSKVHGLGVFANRDMNAGDVITIYPADIAIEMIDEKTNQCNILISKELYDLKFSEVGFTKENLIELCSDFCRNYLVKLTEAINISATPEMYDDVAYVGHMINDGTEVIPTDENMVEEYEMLSESKQNCYFKYYNNLLFVIAKKSISKDDELFVTYGSKYWLSDRTKPIE